MDEFWYPPNIILKIITIYFNIPVCSILGFLMKRLTTKIDQIVLLCKNVQKTSALYCETLGLRVHLQSQRLVELRDANNLRLLLKLSEAPSQLCKGYSPIVSFKVENFEQVHAKMIRNQLLMDGDTVQLPNGKIAAFAGFEGEIICINNLVEEQDYQDNQQASKEQEQIGSAQIKRILQNIRM